MNPLSSRFPPAPLSRFASAVLTSLLLWTGCAAPQGKEVRGATRVTAPPMDPTIEIQSRLLQDAKLSFAQGRYETTTRLLRRLIKTYPKSPLLPEAYWWLARSYEQAGDITEALAQYRLLVQAAREGSFGLQAKNRIAELERALAVTPNQGTGLAAILIPTRRLPPQEGLDEWVRQLAQAGFTTLVVEAGTVQAQGQKRGPNGQPPPQAGVYFQTHWAPTIRDVVGQLVPVAHRHGLRVFSAVALWRMNWLEPQLGWTEQTYDQGKRQLVASERLDLFHPAFQEYLIGLLSDLAVGGVDGVFFRTDVPLESTEGFSPYGFKGFERDFGVKLDPATLYGSADPGTSGKNQRDSAPEFWRWVGWRARETLRVMDRLRQALRKQSPQLQFALGVHPEAVTDPLGALVRLNEDFLEAKRLGFDSYVIGEPLSAGSGGGERLVKVIEQAVQLIGEARQIWVAVPPSDRESARGFTGLKPEADRMPFAKGTGIMYMPIQRVPAGAVP